MSFSSASFRRFGALVIVTLGIGCGRSDTLDDFGFDGGLPDSSVDTGLDSGAFDSGFDSGFDSFPPFDTGIVFDTSVSDTDIPPSDTIVPPFDTGFDTGTFDTGFDTGTFDTDFDTGTFDTDFDTGTFDTGTFDTGFDTGTFDTGFDSGDSGDSGGDAGIICGASMCDPGSQDCCATGPTALVCVAKGTCIGTPLSCSSAAACKPGQVCCFAGGAGATCSSICFGITLCGTSAECMPPFKCQPIFGGYKICRP